MSEEDTDSAAPSVDAVEMAREEAHRTIDNQIDTLNDIDNKAARILRINLVVISILLTGLSVISQPQPESGDSLANSVFPALINNYTIAGLILIISSTAVAAVTYTSSDLRGGMSGSDIRDLLNNEYTDRQNLEGVVESYSRWIDHNYRTNARNAPLGTLTLLLLVYAITALSLGLKQAVTGGVGLWLLAVAIGANVVLTWYTRFHTQVQRGIALWQRRRAQE